MLPKHVRYQTALHPVRVLPTQATLIIIPETRFFVNTFFQKNQKNFEKVSVQGFAGMLRVKKPPMAGCHTRSLRLCFLYYNRKHQPNRVPMPHSTPSIVHPEGSPPKCGVSPCHYTPLLTVENPMENHPYSPCFDRKPLPAQPSTVFHILWFVWFFTKQNTKCCVLFY